MGNIWVLIKNNLFVSVIKKKTTFLIGLFAPLVILIAMGKILNFGGGNITIGVVDNDNSKTSVALMDFISEDGIFRIIDVNELYIENSFAQKDIDGFVSIPKDFEIDLISGVIPKITVKGREHDGIDKILTNIMFSEISNIEKLAKASSNNKEVYLELLDNYNNNGDIKIQKQSLSDLRSDYLISSIYVGFIIFFMLLRGSNGAVHYFDEKRENVFNRFFMAPVKAYQYYLADLISNFLIVVIQAVIGVIGIAIIGTNTGVKSFELLIIMASIGLVSVSLAICIRAFSKNNNEFSMIYNFIMMALVMVGGCFVPLEIMPKLVNNISYLTPVRWAMEAVYDLQVGVSFVEVLPYVLIMILFAITFFVMAAYKTAKADKEFSI